MFCFYAIVARTEQMLRIPHSACRTMSLHTMHFSCSMNAFSMFHVLIYKITEPVKANIEQVVETVHYYVAAVRYRHEQL